jgi:MFS family permease
VRSGEGAPRLGPGFGRLVAASALANLGDGVRGVALPLIAAGLTRDPLAFSAVAVAGSLPWLVVSLPAGVVVDRLERRRLMVGANVVRAVLLALLALSLVAERASVPLLVVVALGLGTAEVLFDNAAQTLLPSIVEPRALERANGRLSAVEIGTNLFAGPPLGGALLAVALALPVVVDAGLLAGSAILVAGLPRGAPPTGPATGTPGAGRRFVVELREGVGWLARHRLLRTLALLLAVLNGTASMGMATFALYATGAGSVLGLGPVGFSLVLTAGSVGAFAASGLADRSTIAFGRARSLWATLAVFVAAPLAFALARGVTAVVVASIATAAASVVWNVITVSLRQTIIPDRLLGRVNSAYRFLGWGAMPVGAAIGGVVARVGGLRAPWFLAAALTALTLPFAARVLREDVIRAARDGGRGPATDDGRV